MIPPKYKPEIKQIISNLEPFMCNFIKRSEINNYFQKSGKFMDFITIGEHLFEDTISVLKDVLKSVPKLTE